MKHFFSIFVLSAAVAFAGIGPIAYAETQDQTQQTTGNQTKQKKEQKANKTHKGWKHSRKTEHNKK